MSLRAWIAAGSTAFAAGGDVPAGTVCAWMPGAASDIASKVRARILRTMVISEVIRAVKSEAVRAARTVALRTWRPPTGDPIRTACDHCIAAGAAHNWTLDLSHS